MKTKIFFSLVLFIVGCSGKPTQEEVVGTSQPHSSEQTVSIESKQIAVEQKADYVAELKFNRRQSFLTEKQKKLLSDQLKLAESQGKVQEIKVITWADQDYPSEQKKTLGKSQLELADRRNSAVQDFLKRYRQNVKIKTYSMAERANAFKEFIGSSEARIKKSLETAGIAISDEPSRNRSQASKSIVLFLAE